MLFPPCRSLSRRLQLEYLRNTSFPPLILMELYTYSKKGKKRMQGPFLFSLAR